jgi:hypothetical protein
MLLKALRESDAFSFEDRRLSFVFVRFFSLKQKPKEKKLGKKKKGRKERFALCGARPKALP